MVLVHPQPATMKDDPALHSRGDAKVAAVDCKEFLKTSQDAEIIKSSDATEATAAESDDEQQSLEAAKANLRALLHKHDRSAKHPEVAKAVEELAAMNPTDDAVQSPFLAGRFVSLTRPEFPGRIKQEGNAHLDQYTLGRMSFNIFQPNDLVCTIVETRNDLVLAPQQEDANDESRILAYPLKTQMIVHTPKGDFPASIHMKAVASSDKQPTNRLGVTFAGGTLTPGAEVRSDSTKLALWKEVFADAYKKAEAERSYVSSFVQFVFKWLFQLTTPTDEEADADETNSVSFEMGRCPHGFIDVLYLDEDLRITKGNRGTVVIVERVPSEE